MTLNLHMTGRGALRGFTLMELLLAMVAFGIVLAAANSVFYSAMRLRNAAARSVENVQTELQAVDIIKKDLTGLTWPGGTFFGDLKPSSTMVTGAVQPAGTMEFYTACAVVSDQLPWGEVQRVSYYLAPATNGIKGMELYRSVTHNLLPVLQEQAEPQWLLAGVRRLTLLFYSGSDWRDTWDSTTETNLMPLAVKMLIERDMADEQSTVRQQNVLEITVPVTVQGTTRQQQETAATGGGA